MPAEARADGFWEFFTAPAAAAGDAISNVFKGLLYGIFLAISFITSMAITLFEWAINPNYASGPTGLLNRESVYTMWKFIRDFFNLFFILTLLYTAFTIIFQVAKDYKKTLLSLVLAALFVNFSFPITRVIIDVTNVPMYYFVNQLAAGKDGKKSLGSVLSASQLRGILIPGAEDGGTVTLSTITVSRLFMAIIFMFIFSVTLLVLAVMFVVRLVALVVLLIFSSVGFAASVIPGMKEYGDKWWKKLSEYALFGPAAMLMLVVATRFFAEIGADQTKAQFVAAATTNAGSQVAAGFIGSMAMFTIPIIMLWMAIGVATSSSLVGASVAVGLGKGVGRYLAYKNPVMRGFAGGAKDRFQGTRVGRWLKSPSGTEAAIKGWTKKTSLNPVPGWRDNGKGRAGARTELQKLKDKQINEQIGKDKENKLSRTDAINRLKSGDEIMRVSAATSLANMDHGIQSMTDLNDVLNALKDPKTGTMNPSYSEKAVEIIAKADKKIIAETKTQDSAGNIITTSGLQNLQTIIGTLGKNEKAISDLISKLDDSAFSGSGADYSAVEAAVRSVNASLVGALDAKVRKEGQAKVLVDAQVAAGATVTAAVQGVLGSMKSIKDLVNAKSLFQDPRYQADAVSYVTTQPVMRYQEIKKVAAQEAPDVFALI